MKKLIFVLAALLFTTGAGAQKLAIGEKAPELRISEWLWGGPSDDSKARLIEFFHPGSSQCAARIGNISAIARKFSEELNVILISKEPAESVRKVTGKDGTYFAAIDDGGKTFEAYSVRFVPFGVLIDRRGRVVWFGNPVSLTESQIKRLIN
ncbi:MAG: redoxin domain-containing protein [Rikenellaceae bacterium]|nr:redoxin domain-containing protein [Rikenellaceae bacterium]